MAMLGDLKEFSLLELFKLVERGAKSGQLTIGSEIGIYRITFFKGRVVTASCPEAERQLSRLLAQSGLVSDRVVTKLASFCPLDEPLGACLCKQDLITPVALAQVFRQQLRLGIYPLLSLGEGPFKFANNTPLPYREMTGLSQRAVVVALEGLRHPDYTYQCETDLPPPETCLCRVGSEPPAFRLTPLEWSILERLPRQGSHTRLLDLSQRLATDLLKVRQVCDRLLRVEVIAEADPDERTEDVLPSLQAIKRSAAPELSPSEPPATLLNRFATVLRSMQQRRA